MWFEGVDELGNDREVCARCLPAQLRSGAAVLVNRDELPGNLRDFAASQGQQWAADVACPANAAQALERRSPKD